MKAIFYRSVYKKDFLPDGIWRKLLPEQEKFVQKKILLNIETGMFLCPVHCRWEDGKIDEEFTFTCGGGKTSCGIIVPYTPEPDEDDPKYFTGNRGVLIRNHIQAARNLYDTNNESILSYGENNGRSLYQKQFLDNEGKDRDLYAYTVEADIEKCTCYITKHFIDSKTFRSINEGNFMLINIPVNETQSKYSFLTPLSPNGTYSFPMKVKDNTSESINYYIDDLAEKLVERFAGRKIRINKDFFHGEALLNALAYYPYEANMFGVMYASISNYFLAIKEVLPEWIDRNSCDVYNDWCSHFGIKSFPQLRKHFNSNPFSLLYYQKLYQLGFRDKNIIMNAIDKEDMKWLISNDRSADCYEFFIEKSLPLRGEKATLHAILKEPDMDLNNRADIAIMFARYYDYLAEEEKNAVLYDGFTNRNHDMLAKISSQLRTKNVTFLYKKSQLEFEDEINGYEFRLPKDCDELHKLGSAMHNCVYSYTDSVISRRCTIVYASHNGVYVMCIEVSMDKRIIQARSDFNDKIKGEEKVIFDQWCEKHSIGKY